MTESNSGNRIMELRKKAAITVKSLAERLNTTESTISRIETGKQNLTQAWIQKISRALGVRVTELLELSDDSSRIWFVTVCVLVDNDVWKESAFYDPHSRYDIPLVRLNNIAPYTLTAFEYEEKHRGWLVCCELPKLMAEYHTGKEFVVSRINQKNEYELSLRVLEVDHKGFYLTSDKGDPSRRIVSLRDDSVLTLWHVLMRYEAYFNAQFGKID